MNISYPEPINVMLLLVIVYRYIQSQDYTFEGNQTGSGIRS